MLIKIGLAIQVTEEIEGTRFNTGISAMMEFTNAAYKVLHDSFCLSCNKQFLVFRTCFGYYWPLICHHFVLRIQWDRLPRLILESFLLLLAPYAPHMAEELWFRLGHLSSLAYVPFPKVNLYRPLLNHTDNRLFWKKRKFLMIFKTSSGFIRSICRVLTAKMLFFVSG